MTRIAFNPLKAIGGAVVRGANIATYVVPFLMILNVVGIYLYFAFVVLS